ncbi:MAG: PKD domain-containing protein [Opitutales bacterium]
MTLPTVACSRGASALRTFSAYTRRAGLLSLALILGFDMCTTARAMPNAVINQNTFPGGFPQMHPSGRQWMEGEYIAGPVRRMQGRTAVLFYHNGYVMSTPEVPGSLSGSDFNIRIFDLSQLGNGSNAGAQPNDRNMNGTRIVAGDSGELGDGSAGFQAHGSMKTGPVAMSGGWRQRFWYNEVGNNWHVWRGDNWSDAFRNELGFANNDPVDEVIGHTHILGSRGALFSPYFARAWWSYGTVSGNADLLINGQQVASWDHLGLTGVVSHPFIIGNLLIMASDQSRTGIATYDISDPSNPVLLDVLNDGNIGSYWPEVWGHYVVFGKRGNDHGLMLVDFSDPTDLKISQEIRTPYSAGFYQHFQDEFCFFGPFKVDMRTGEIVLQLDAQRGNNDGIDFPSGDVRRNPTEYNLNGSNSSLILGNLWLNGGGASQQGLAIWAHQSEPDTRPPFPAYHIPQDGQTNYPTGGYPLSNPMGPAITVLIHETLESTTINDSTVIVRPLGGNPLDCTLNFSMNDFLTIVPRSPLQDNTTYEVILEGIEDAAGNAMERYVFSFSTGSAVGGNQSPVINAFTADASVVNPGDSVNFSVAATDPESEALEYRFEFGDGAPTPWQSSPTTSHTYNEVGRFSATVQVRDASNRLSTARLPIGVVNPFTAQNHTRTTPILCDPLNNYFITVNPDNNSVTAVDISSEQVVYETAVGLDPRTLALDAFGNLWVTCFDGDQLDILNAETGALTNTVSLPYGSAPYGIAPSPDGMTLYVSLHGSGKLLRFDAAFRNQTGTIDLDITARAIAVKGDGNTAYVTRFISEGEHGTVWKIDLSSFSLDQTIDLLMDPGIIDLETGNNDEEAIGDSEFGGRGVPSYLAGITISPDGTKAWITGNKYNVQRGLFADGNEPNEVNTVRAVVIELNLTDDSEDILTRRDVDNSASPTAVEFSPMGDYGFVALEGNNAIAVYDTLKNSGNPGLATVTRLATDPASPPEGAIPNYPTKPGIAPQGLCYDPVSGKLAAKAFMSRSMTIFDIGALLSAADINVPSRAVETVVTELLSNQVLIGKQVFYNAEDLRMGSQGYISCATCHVDGGHDGRTWDFTNRGEGMRNTTDLRGREATAHGNVHWSANFDELQDFENDIRGFFGGTGFLTDAQFNQTQNTLGTPKAGLSAELDAMAAYLVSLQQASYPRSPYRNADGTMTPEALAGKLVFNSNSCADCHSGANFTDSTLGTATLNNVGTIKTGSGNRLGGPLNGIDTPTLLGLWASAPYLHDGTAADLHEVFATSGSTRATGGTTYQAENATLAGGSQTRTNPIYNSFHQQRIFPREGGYVNMRNGTLTFNNIDGGTGGPGRIVIRYGGTFGRTASIQLNGSSLGNITLPGWGRTNDQDNPPRWMYVILENVNLVAGNNQLRLNHSNINIDEIFVSNANNLAATNPHTRVSSLSQADYDALIAYLLQLDGRPENSGEINLPPSAITSVTPGTIPYGDGFYTVITLDGSASTDIDGTLASYFWDAPGAQFVSTTDPTSPIAYVVYDGSQSNPVTLTVTDDDGAIASEVSQVAVLGEVGSGLPGFIESGGQVAFEAENGFFASPTLWQTNADAAASSGAYIEVTPGNNSLSTPPASADGIVSYPFKIETPGDYMIWLRAITPSSSDDSIWVRMNNGNWVRYNSIGAGASWTWRIVHDADNGNDLVIYALTSGDHTLDIAYREDGTQVDKFALSNDFSGTSINFNPQTINGGLGPAQSAFDDASSNSTLAMAGFELFVDREGFDPSSDPTTRPQGGQTLLEKFAGGIGAGDNVVLKVDAQPTQTHMAFVIDRVRIVDGLTVNLECRELLTEGDWVDASTYYTLSTVDLEPGFQQWTFTRNTPLTESPDSEYVQLQLALQTENTD